MSAIPTSTDEISLYYAPETGLRVECSQMHVAPLQLCLTNAAFLCQGANVAVSGTGRIQSRAEFAVEGGTFEAMRNAVSAFLQAADVDVEEEDLSSLAERHIQLNLIDVSVDDR